MNRTRVLVYGSLKDDECNNDALVRHNGVMLGEVKLKGPFKMFNWSWFPAVFTDPSFEEREIVAEVWEIDEVGLAVLDIIEGHPSFFKRDKYDTPFKRAWMYTMNPQYLDERKPLVESGCWTGDASYVDV